jgi:acetyl-CoA/propionyl-CoA carboxylase, biotin carboxylase, biotin carboxyl carrier protein
MLDSVLVANRGEIAVRIMRTLRRLGVRAIAVHSDADAGAPHVAAADEAVRIGPAAAAQSYLRLDGLIEAAAATGAQAIHPGYGFLSESAAFARAVAGAGLVWVGPPPAAIESMGDKIRAKQTVEAAGVPVVPGVHRPGMDDASLLVAADEVGFPLMVKATAGGGGKGMRVVQAAEALPEAIAAARREAMSAFGDDDLLLERFVTAPRHIEIQVLRDVHGTGLALGERECSLQRRHQKVVEEAPSPLLDHPVRAAMSDAAVAAADACDYTGAGTVELIVSGNRPDDFFFLEMNTRLQVEHPVTELVWGLDLVEWQLRIAAGESIAVLGDAAPQGHAVEARVYAEDPDRGFLPTGGRIVGAHQRAAGARVDTGVTTGSVIGSDYDPMLAKVIVHAADRPTALRRLEAALADYHLLGVTTNVAFLRALLAHPLVRAGELDTGLIERELGALTTPHAVGDRGAGITSDTGPAAPGASASDAAADAAADAVADAAADAARPGGEGGTRLALLAAALLQLAALEPAVDAASTPVDPFDLPGGWRVGAPAPLVLRLAPLGGEVIEVRALGRADGAQVVLGAAAPVAASLVVAGEELVLTVDGRTHRFVHAADGAVLWLGCGGRTWGIRRVERLAAAAQERSGSGPLLAPMPGTVTVVHVEQGAHVTAGQALLVVEAMKMEHPITAPVDGVVTALHVAAGAQVAMDEPLALVEAEPEVTSSSIGSDRAPEEPR